MDRDGQDEEKEMKHSSSNAFDFRPAFLFLPAFCFHPVSPVNSFFA
ncbi:MAG TPA: hypothetical protein VF553_09065 [Pyrinomonadaceae bacterium]|jgi:hypothetical protein